MTCLHAGLAMFAGLLGAHLALQHPLWSGLLTVVFAAWCLAVYLRPQLWLTVLPALLPMAGFSPWTGWIGVEEFDLLALGAAAGSHAGLAAGRCERAPGYFRSSQRVSALVDRAADSGRCGESASTRWFRLAQVVSGLLAASYLLALGRGLADAGGFPLGWFEGYEKPLNSLRLAKSFFLVLLLVPSLRSLLRRTPTLAGRRLVAGLLSGLGLVALAIVCERAGYPGIFNFSTPYRSTALFWEMHVGGAAVDGFLALTVPFVAYALAHARTPWRWALVAALAVVAAYACLTTFSRAVYLAVAVSLIVLAGRLAVPWRQRCRPGDGAILAPAPERWRVRGNRLLAALLTFEVLAVLGLGNYMSTRVAASERDLGGRLEHWREGLHLLRVPSELLLGRGLGRFPANYSQTVPGRAMPGRLQIIEGGEGSHLRIFRPPHGARARGAFELLQRLPPLGDGTYTVAMDLRAPQLASLRVAVCQKHLLYAAFCLQTAFAVLPADGEWRRFSITFAARQGSGGVWRAPTLGFLSLRLEGPADCLDVDNLSVLDAAGHQLLENGDFSSNLAHWFFAGYQYFLPWHVDNLFLEMLIDQGAIGLLLLLALLAMAFGNLLSGPGRGHVLAPYLLAALAGGLAVGVFSSLLDMPRAAFLFYLLLCCALYLQGLSPENRIEPLPAPLQTP
ncbi:MAG: hypothetical protein IPK02_21460 [Candidatus Accumulibacter sp.]|uniref:O-antigen ligase family protein n=1 Tax=Candidatus Accumulibacter affinis TaxID=2954384 RepID=A0A935TAZ9_9PROT|nr:hypothetical protein [Candidatus Accumulibacter affinis]